MSENTLPNYAEFLNTLTTNGLSVTPAELHGLLTGMLSAGLNIEKDSSWQPLLFDYTNEGKGWPLNALTEASALLTLTQKELIASSFDVSLLLPPDEEPGVDGLFDLADAVSEWVNHFISGLGLMGIQMKSMSEDCREALVDLEEIGKLGIDENDDLEEQAQLLIQVIEHLKACVLTIFCEYGDRRSEQKQTVH